MFAVLGRARQSQGDEGARGTTTDHLRGYGEFADAEAMILFPVLRLLNKPTLPSPRAGGKAFLLDILFAAFEKRGGGICFQTLLETREWEL